MNLEIAKYLGVSKYTLANLNLTVHCPHMYQKTSLSSFMNIFLGRKLFLQIHKTLVPPMATVILDYIYANYDTTTGSFK